jgi:rhodanese-related sulfurtransferase
MTIPFIMLFYLNEAFKLMSANPDHLLLDVRSPGEYADTSAATALNIGRFKVR